MECLHTNSPSLLQHFIRPSDVLTVSTIRSVSTGVISGAATV